MKTRWPALKPPLRRFWFPHGPGPALSEAAPFPLLISYLIKFFDPIQKQWLTAQACGLETAPADPAAR